MSTNINSNLNNKFNNAMSNNNNFSNKGGVTKSKFSFKDLLKKKKLVLVLGGVFLLIIIAVIIIIIIQLTKTYKNNKLRGITELVVLNKMYDCRNNSEPMIISGFPEYVIGNNYNLTFWIYINNLKHNYNEKKFIITKGDISNDGDKTEGFPESNPSIFMEEKSNTMVFRFRTLKGAADYRGCYPTTNRLLLNKLEETLQGRYLEESSKQLEITDNELLKTKGRLFKFDNGDILTFKIKIDNNLLDTTGIDKYIIPIFSIEEEGGGKLIIYITKKDGKYKLAFDDKDSADNATHHDVHKGVTKDLKKGEIYTIKLTNNIDNTDLELLDVTHNITSGFTDKTEKKLYAGSSSPNIITTPSSSDEHTLQSIITGNTNLEFRAYEFKFKPNPILNNQKTLVDCQKNAAGIVGADYYTMTNVSKTVANVEDYTAECTPMTKDDIATLLENKVRTDESMCINKEDPVPNSQAETGSEEYEFVNLTHSSLNEIDAACSIQNFPIQTWSCVSINVHNNISDIFHDGKLVSTCTHLNPILPNNSDMFLAAHHKLDGYLTSITYTNKNLSHKEINKKYRKGPTVFQNVLRNLFTAKNKQA